MTTLTTCFNGLIPTKRLHTSTGFQAACSIGIFPWQEIWVDESKQEETL